MDQISDIVIRGAEAALADHDREWNSVCENVQGQIAQMKQKSWQDLWSEIAQLEQNSQNEGGFLREMLSKSWDTGFGSVVNNEEFRWFLFDIFKWTLTYEKKLDLEILHGDIGPLPPSWRVCVSLWLYNSLAHISRWTWTRRTSFEKKLAKHRDINKMPWLQSLDMKIIRRTLKHCRGLVDAHNQILDNMSLELSVALAEIDREDRNGSLEVSGHPQPITEVLKKEISQGYPELVLHDLVLSLDE